MSETRTYQVHANVNVADRDASLRLSITFYDEGGHQVAHQTWRKHVRALWYDSGDWTAYSAAVELAKMMGEVCGTSPQLEEPDTPLF